jgi:hypothetical protein
MILVLTAQGWTGDTVNLFTTFPPGRVDQSFSGFSSAVSNAGLILNWHVVEGVLVLALSVLILALSVRSRHRGIVVTSILGALAVVSAGVGGVLFVLSGFSDNGASAQMGGSFIGAYAFYFVELYYTK